MQVRRALPALLGLCVVLAGCSGGASLGASEERIPANESPPEAVTAADDRVWPDETITVAVADDTGGDREWGPLVRRALAFWEDNAERYAGYPVDFEYRPEADDPDVLVRFVTSVEDCRRVEDPVGCAPHITAPAEIDRPVTVSVQAGLTANSTVLVLRHEFGHVLGLEHDDEPRDVMEHGAPIATLPQRNATERALPWPDDTLAVYVDASGVSREHRPTVRRQIREALAYYENGADGTVPANLSFERVESRMAADVVVTFPEKTPCGSDSGSCGVRRGVDPDRDDAFERYTGLEITISGVDPRATGWHVAYWLGYGMGFEDERDWPAPLRNASADERRSEWWRSDASVRSAP